MYTDITITEVFENFFNQYQDMELAEESFRETMQTDSDLKEMYREWCDETGYTNKKGFRSYFQNKHESDNIWDSIFPNSEEYEGYDQ